MSSQNNHIFKDEEHAGGKLGRKFAESPFMLVGKLKLLKYHWMIVQCSWGGKISTYNLDLG